MINVPPLAYNARQYLDSASNGQNISTVVLNVGVHTPLFKGVRVR